MKCTFDGCGRIAVYRIRTGKLIGLLCDMHAQLMAAKVGAEALAPMPTREVA